MKALIPIIVVVGVLIGIAMMFTSGWDRPPIDSTQIGFRGTGMTHTANPRMEAQKISAIEIPEPPDDLNTEGPRASTVYENLQLLGDVSEDQFNRLMLAITEWVSPEEGCGYCHNEENLAEDSKYTKVVSRKMIQMTRKINSEFQDHVADTGVTCYTCHRGKPVPEHIWFTDPHSGKSTGMVGGIAGQNIAGENVGSTSLPSDPFSELLEKTEPGEPIRVIGGRALPLSTNGASIQQTEKTYGLMIHLSEALGVSCNHCHNSRSFFDWAQSTPERIVAWHGLNMVRGVNSEFLLPLSSVLPKNRLGVLGDAPKLNCTTCHQGVAKPLNGAKMAKDYPSLQK